MMGWQRRDQGLRFYEFRREGRIPHFRQMAFTLD